MSLYQEAPPPHCSFNLLSLMTREVEHFFPRKLPFISLPLFVKSFAYFFYWIVYLLTDLHEFFPKCFVLHF